MLVMSQALGRYFLPHVPHNTTGYEGFLVSDLAGRYFLDSDGEGDLGLGIIAAQEDVATGKLSR